MLKASNDIRAYIKTQEGFMAKAYKDGFINGVQQYSIGYGHQIRSNEKNLLTATLTKQQASDLFDKDLGTYEASVNLSKLPLNQDQYDALVDFAYNCGTGAVAKILSTWYSSGGNVAKTIEHIKKYVYSSGAINPVLVKRREYEANLFSNSLANTAKKQLPHC
jgi:lysozyme